MLKTGKGGAVVADKTLMFPVFEKSWGDYWFEQGYWCEKDDGGHTREQWQEVFDRVTEDPGIEDLIGRAMDLWKAESTGFPEFVDKGKYLVIPLDHDRNLHREAYNEVNGSEEEEELSRLMRGEAD